MAKKRTAKKTPKKQGKPATRGGPAKSTRIPKRTPKRTDPDPPPPSTREHDDAVAYERKKESSRAREADISRSGRDIGKIPDVVDPKRRASCEHDLERFYKTYFPGTFKHPWSPVHLKLIGMIQFVILSGWLLAIGIPRGWGKTTLCVRAVLWAIAYRHHTFCVLIAATNDAADNLLNDLRVELSKNKLLREDFPELCLPLAAIGEQTNKQKGQLSADVPTGVNYDKSAGVLQMATINGVPGCRLVAGGILSSRLRGLRFVVALADGSTEIWRPTLGLGDDVQSDASAASPRSTVRREKVVQATLPGLPGVGEPWACLLALTVIEADDLADRVLDDKVHPDWNGIRHQFLNSLPSDLKFDEDKNGLTPMDYWRRWNDHRIVDLAEEKAKVAAAAAASRKHKPTDPKSFKSSKYFKRHKRRMMAGADVGWIHAFNPKKHTSAIEHAMEWYFRSRSGFWSELQNNPAGFESADVKVIRRDIVVDRTHHLKTSRVPLDAETVVVFADVQKKVLYYEVRAYNAASTCYVLDYGTWPGQSRAFYTLDDIRLTMAAKYPKIAKWPGQLRASIRDLFKGTEKKPGLLRRDWIKEDGSALRIGPRAAGIDCNYEKENIVSALRAEGLAGVIVPMHGRGYMPTQKGIDDLKSVEGTLRGTGWMIPPAEKGQLRHCLFDSNKFKAYERDSLVSPKENDGAVLLPGGRDHRMWAEHHLAESSSIVTSETHQRTCELFTLKPGRPDNHLYDTGAGCHVLASIAGVPLAGFTVKKTKRKSSKSRSGRKISRLKM